MRARVAPDALSALLNLVEGPGRLSAHVVHKLRGLAGSKSTQANLPSVVL